MFSTTSAMQVEFCITAEGGDTEGTGRLQGMRGIDHSVYYRQVCACMHVPGFVRDTQLVFVPRGSQHGVPKDRGMTTASFGTW